MRAGPIVLDADSDDEQYDENSNAVFAYNSPSAYAGFSETYRVLPFAKMPGLSQERYNFLEHGGKSTAYKVLFQK